MISKPRTALGGGLLAAVLLASGCQARVGSAATIGDAQISTKTLNTAYEAAAQTSSGKAAGAKLQSQVLTQLIQHEQYLLIAKKLGLSVPQGVIDANYQSAIAQAGANRASEPDFFYRDQAEELSSVVAVMSYYYQQTKKVDAVDLYAVPVADQATATKVLALLKANPQNAAAIAGQYSSNAGLKASGGLAGPQSISSLAVPALATVPLNTPTIQTVGGAPAVLIVRARLDSAALQTALDALPKVKVNPRFGTWGTDTTTNANGVIPISSDVVTTGAAPAASATPVASGAAAPSGAVAPSASAAAPSAVAPSGAAAVPSASTGVVPSATAAPAPSATAAPAPSATPSAAPSAAPSS